MKPYSMSESMPDLRKNYEQEELGKTDLLENPIIQFKTWFDQALGSDEAEPNAMTLATATPEGKPSARTLLIKGLSTEGIVFYTNYKSRKGRELAQNPHGAAVFYWPTLERQVRLEGLIKKIPQAESQHYFSLRPRESQLSAWVSAQSEPVDSREVLLNAFNEVEKKYHEIEIPCPEHWGGYCLQPMSFEFWQGRPGRLHDRLKYTLDAGVWGLERLAP